MKLQIPGMSLSPDFASIGSSAGLRQILRMKRSNFWYLFIKPKVIFKAIKVTPCFIKKKWKSMSILRVSLSLAEPMGRHTSALLTAEDSPKVKEAELKSHHVHQRGEGVQSLSVDMGSVNTGGPCIFILI